MEDNSTEVSVSDTGIGIEPSLIPRLFNPLEKIVTSGTNEEKGTGLGLMICDELVKKLEGSIHIESTPGKGSRFYFNLPVLK
jgi:signal transduction histidine kinase